MKLLKHISTILLLSASLQATTIYYNGEGNDIGEWSIQPDSTDNASLIEVHDNTLDSTVIQFTDGGVYRLRLPNNTLWANATETLLSFDMRLGSYYTISVYVDTLDGVRKLFYNAINVNVGWHLTGILNGIGNGRTHMFEHRAWQINRGEDVQNNQNGWVRATLDLDRELTDTEPDNRVVRVLSMRIAGTSGRIDNVSLDNPERTTLAATANRWSISPGIPAGGNIVNHQENDDRGNVVSFSGTATSNSYTAGASTGANRWNNTEHDILQWKMRTISNFSAIVHTTTTNGTRDIIYSTDRTDGGLNLADGVIGIGLGWSRNGDGTAYGNGTDNRWQTYTRNIATDIAEFENGNSLVAINGMTVMGTNGRLTNSPMVATNILIDDIQLFSSIVPTLTTGVASELHGWRLRENSVRISFVDNSDGETEFRYINTDTNQVIGNALPATNGTGTTSIGQINELNSGTTYHIAVQTIFNNGQATITSEPLEFTTLGELQEETNAQAADDLHGWRLRENSIRISFVDNSEGETGFRYINTDTNQVVGNAVPASNGTGSSRIGQINGLNAGTTYHIAVQTLFNNGQATITSQPLEFTTLGQAQEENNAEDAADDLHRWRLRATSSRVSFRDNSNGEIGFRFINDATGVQMRNDLPATNGTGTASIGQMNGLTPNTNYTVRIHTLFNNGRATAISEPLSFRTLAQ
ncbi:MAG: hypothetical protein KAG56_02240 [Sulfurovaceae bacterium]|nr:hypothetical protein [Sulfurovaceae bacterium]